MQQIKCMAWAHVPDNTILPNMKIANQVLGAKNFTWYQQLFKPQPSVGYDNSSHLHFTSEEQAGWSYHEAFVAQEWMEGKELVKKDQRRRNGFDWTAPLRQVCRSEVAKWIENNKRKHD